MPLRQSSLLEASTRLRKSAASSLFEARRSGIRTAFLCHSHLDVELVKGLVALLADAGWNVYVDWTDTTLPASPDRETARRLQERIDDADFFLFLATARSISSRWCPWEIGYANGVKDLARIVVVPTSDGTSTHGSEYLQLYRRLDISEKNQLAVWEPGTSSNGKLVNAL